MDKSFNNTNPKQARKIIIVTASSLLVVLIIIISIGYAGLNFFGAFQDSGENIGPKTLTQVGDFALGNILESFDKQDHSAKNNQDEKLIENLNLKINQNESTVPLVDLNNLVAVSLWGINNVPKYATVSVQNGDVPRTLTLYLISNGVLEPVLINNSLFSHTDQSYQGYFEVYGDALGNWYVIGSLKNNMNEVFKLDTNIATLVTGFPTDSNPDYLGLAFDNKGGWYANFGNKSTDGAVGYRINGTIATYLPKVKAPSGVQYFTDSEGNWYFLDLVSSGEDFTLIPRVSYLYRISGDKVTQIKKDNITLCRYNYTLSCGSI